MVEYTLNEIYRSRCDTILEAQIRSAHTERGWLVESEGDRRRRKAGV